MLSYGNGFSYLVHTFLDAYWGIFASPGGSPADHDLQLHAHGVGSTSLSDSRPHDVGSTQRLPYPARSCRSVLLAPSSAYDYLDLGHLGGQESQIDLTLYNTRTG